MPEWFDMMKQQIAPEPETTPCPECGDALPCLVVKKESPNRGRPFISCRECDLFRWLDIGQCEKCKDWLYAGTVKKEGQHKGKRFIACPNRCSFDYV